MNHGDRVTITCKPNSNHHHPEIREKRAAMNGKTGEVVTIATLSGDVLVEADGVRSWFWASELTPAPSVEAELRATIAGLRDELANEKAAHAECERLLSEARKRLETTTDKVLEQHDARIEAEKRRQRAAQVLIEEIGAPGPETLEATAARAVAEIRRLKAATPPIAQALDLLRRVRSVLYNVGVVRSNVDAEIDALLVGTPVVGSRAIGALRSTLESLHGMMPDHAFDALHAAVRDVENASRPEPSRAPLPEVDAGELWRDFTKGLGEVCEYERNAFVAGVEAGRRTRAPLTEEDARRWERLRVVASAIRDREYEGDFRVSDETAMLFDELRHAIAAVENTQTATPQRAPLTEAQALVVALQTTGASGELVGKAQALLARVRAVSRGEVPPDVRSAPASSPLGEWQCASCHARETEAHRAWCQVEDKAGTIARHAPPHTHPLSPEDAARGFVPAWTDDKPNTMAAPSERPKTPGLKARLAGVTCPSCGAPLALCECPTNCG